MIKKKITTFALVGALGLASLGMVGCGATPPPAEEAEEANPYIQVMGLDTAYFVGGQINLEGAKVLYYSDIDDTTVDEYALEGDMISGFDSASAGSKKLKVEYSEAELEIDYSVISKADFISMYNTAYDNFLLEQNVFVEAVMNVDNVIFNISYLSMTQSKSYQVNLDGNRIWEQKEGDNWYLCRIDQKGNKTKREITAEVENENLLTSRIKSVTPLTSKISGESELDNFSLFYDIEGDVHVFELINTNSST